MTENQMIIFSDSEALIGDIEFVFKNKLDFISSGSIGWVIDYIHHHYVKLLIADMDMKTAVQTEVLDKLREFGNEETAILFLVSEQKRLELEKKFGDLSGLNVSADWLIKPFSRNSLISSVDHLCG